MSRTCAPDGQRSVASTRTSGPRSSRLARELVAQRVQRRAGAVARPHLRDALLQRRRAPVGAAGHGAPAGAGVELRLVARRVARRQVEGVGEVAGAELVRGALGVASGGGEAEGEVEVGGGVVASQVVQCWSPLGSGARPSHRWYASVTRGPAPRRRVDDAPGERGPRGAGREPGGPVPDAGVVDVALHGLAVGDVEVVHGRRGREGPAAHDERGQAGRVGCARPPDRHVAAEGVEQPDGPGRRAAARA